MTTLNNDKMKYLPEVSISSRNLTGNKINNRGDNPQTNTDTTPKVQ
jgi:hypothetical protein